MSTSESEAKADPPKQSALEIESNVVHGSISLLSQQQHDVTIQQLLGGSLGNILEWYDFAVFGYLASEISVNFFPEGQHSLQLIETYGVFAGAFIMRPIGGMVFGVMGDRYGRKLALMVSMCLMFVATFLLGCLPSYDHIGVWATVLLTILRLFQGLSVGGQLVGSMLFLIESAAPEKKGFYGSIVMMTATVGTMLGSVIVSIVDACFTQTQMENYGWRIPFLLSAIVGVAGFLIQRGMEDSREFTQASEHKQLKQNPLMEAWRTHWKDIIYIAIVDASWCAGFYTCFIWLANYVSDELGPDYNAMVVNDVMMVWLFICLVVGGIISDKTHYYTTMKYSCLIILIVAIPGFALMEKYYKHWPILVLFQFFIAIGIGGFGGPMQIFMVDAVDSVSVRYSVMGIAYNLCQCLFGGTAPVISEAISLVSIVWIGVYLAAIAIVSGALLQYRSSTRVTNTNVKRVEIADRESSDHRVP